MWQEIGGFSGYKSNITNMLLTQTQRAMSTTFFRVQQCTLGSNMPDEYAAKQKKKTAIPLGWSPKICLYDQSIIITLTE